LLWILVQDKHLSEEQARTAHNQVQRYLCLRSESAYVHAVRHLQKDDEQELEKLREQQREGGYTERLGSLLVQADLLDQTSDTTIKNKAIRALDHENNRALEKARASSFFN